MEFRYEIKIPKERVAVLVGTSGTIKRKIEKKLDIKMQINSKEGDVIVIGEDSLKLLSAQNIVKAVGRGFNPNIALELTDTDIVIYGKTIGIIGSYEGVKLARIALDSLLGGSRHTTIYSWLEKEKKKRMATLY